MEARSQLRHRPTFEDTTNGREGTSNILADRAKIVNARQFLPFLPQDFSGIIDRAPHLHNFSNTI
jgi:hypothetical protein